MPDPIPARRAVEAGPPRAEGRTAEEPGAARLSRRGVAGLVAFPALSWARPARGEQGWALLRAGGTVAVIRHARAPGFGDPPGFDLSRCATQRNLSEEGRAQARRLGEAFRAERVAVGRVLSSGWCRALETGRLAFGEGVERDPALDSFFADRAEAPRHAAAMAALVEGWRNRPDCLVLVTHQVNVTALTGVVPAEGEIVVAAPRQGGVVVLARMAVG